MQMLEALADIEIATKLMEQSNKNDDMKYGKIIKFVLFFYK